MSRLELYLFSVEPRLVARAARAGIDGVVVDWERRGKRDRQRGADTEINDHTREDLERVRATTSARILCRVNPVGLGSTAELEAAIAGGADEVLLPMVRSAAEVEEALGIVDGRVGVGILVETESSVSAARELASLPLSRVYVGLNDLAIERDSETIFEALVDGTVEHVRAAFDVPFGLAGLTDPERGAPIRCRLIIGELLRLGSTFTFLRRSFHRDLVHPGLEDGVVRLRRAIEEAGRRSSSSIESDRWALGHSIAELRPHAVAATSEA